MDQGKTRVPLALVLSIALLSACSLFAKSPALQSPLRQRLAKAGTTSIEDAAKTCLAAGGWKPDDVGGLAEGATVVSATNGAKDRVSLYIQPPDLSPRVTGGPPYDDPFWKCLGREVGSPKAPADEASSQAKEGSESKRDGKQDKEE